jgi:hypothetical protein
MSALLAAALAIIQERTFSSQKEIRREENLFSKFSKRCIVINNCN